MANHHARNTSHVNWLDDWECRLIVEYYLEHFEEDYRHCAYMMMDAEIVHVKPSTVYKVLCRFGIIRHWSRKPSRRGREASNSLSECTSTGIWTSHTCISGGNPTT